MTTNRGGPCVVSDKYLYAIGGKTENDNANDPFKYLSTVERYDPKTNTWQETAPMHVRRAYACGVAVGGRLYVVGGTQDDCHGNESCLHKLRATTDMLSIAVRCLVPGPHYSARSIRFGSRGPREEVRPRQKSFS